MITNISSYQFLSKLFIVVMSIYNTRSMLRGRWISFFSLVYFRLFLHGVKGYILGFIVCRLGEGVRPKTFQTPSLAH